MFDLGEEKSIGMVRADFFEYGDSAILFPQNISVSVSDDGQTWTPLGEANTKIYSGHIYVCEPHANVRMERQQNRHFWTSWSH